MRKIVITALVAMLSCAAFSQSHPARYGWKEHPTEKFALSNRAKRKLPLETVPIGGGENAMINVQLSINSRSTCQCRMLEAIVSEAATAGVTELAANCSLRKDNKPRYIVIEDANQAGLTEVTKATEALNKVKLAISDYTCEKHCPKFE